MFVSMKENIEIWRPVVGYEELYEISNQGRVKNLVTGKLLKLTPDNKHYLRAFLYKDKKGKMRKVHRLVAFAFPEICGKYFEGAVCNHKNEKVWDNRAENLEWCTPKYNSNYGTAIQRRVEKVSKPVAQYTLEGILVAIYSSPSEAERLTGFKQGGISMCCLGKCKQAYGYIWCYV